MTSPVAYAAQPTVNLQTAAPFAVLSGTGVTDVPTSVITGNVGVSPATGASITGLTCAEVSGTIYDNNGGYSGGGGGSTACLVTNPNLITSAKNDLTTAYTDAAGRTPTTTYSPIYDLGGSTLTSGVYNDPSSFAITGTLTLDAQGNANAVFIFQAGSTLTTASSSKVVLTNGAQACNVYWQVGSSATLGTSTTLIGNVLALTSITDNGSSTVNGRLLARNGAVTLNKTNIAKQTCAAGTTGAPATVSSSSSSSGGSSSSSTGTKVCPTLTNIAPILIESRRVSPTSIFISWGPYSGKNTFNVRYGLANGNWLYNTSVTGFSTTLNGLPSNQPIWVQVATTDSCSLGNYGAAMLVGGPSLPNTGLGLVPHENNISWNIAIPAGIVILVSASLLKNIWNRKSYQGKQY